MNRERDDNKNEEEREIKREKIKRGGVIKENKI